MKHFRVILAILIIVSTTYLFQAGFARAEAIYFDDSDPDIMVLGNSSYYEIGFRKSNGAIAYITDKATGQHVTLGSRYECLWGAHFPDGTPGYVGGCSYNAAWPNHFGYAWSAAPHTLTLNYTPDPAASQQVTAQVVVIASEGPWFDMRLQLQNNWGYILDYIVFPSDLVFIEADIEEALLPILPGVVFEAEFFDQDRSYAAKYPGYPGLFADYVSVSSTKGQIAIYSLYEQGPIRPNIMGFIHDDAYISDSTFYHHNFGARISDGQAWMAPWVRIRISQSPLETINAYRVDNGLDELPSLGEKLGSHYTQVVQSPLLRAVANQLRIPFSEYPDFLSQIPYPGILHPVTYMPYGHDENYPDFLPPDPNWGTQQTFSDMVQDVQAMNFVVMPFINPTWWDDESPTFQDLILADVAVLDEQGSPDSSYECFAEHPDPPECNPENASRDSEFNSSFAYPRLHGGYVVSPYAPFVQQRLDQAIREITEDIPSDMLFEDQIGARPWLFDHNASSPYPSAYMEGWLDHTRTYSDTLLMTELGFDRLVETEVGFHGSVLLPERLGFTPGWWGTDTWHPYPLATLMARDKVLFYQHDLAEQTMAVDKATLTWNLAYGYMLSYDLVETSYGGGLDSDWLELVGAFQKHVLAGYAGEAMTNFTNLEDRVTQTSFETFTVIANWDETNTYNAGEHILPPLGVLAMSADGTVTAGVFTSYNGVPLSAGDHYLIEERNSTNIVVRQPLGADTSLTLDLLPSWSPSDPIEAWAFTVTGQFIGSAAATVTAQDITFFYQQQMGEQSVAYYKVVKPGKIFLPLILKGH